jgi:hypothetical protein
MRIFSAAEVSSMKTNKRQAAATVNRFFIPDLIIQSSSPVKIDLARESLGPESALINEINHACFP